MTIDTVLVKPIVNLLIAELKKVKALKVRKRGAAALNKIIGNVVKIKSGVTVLETKRQIAKVASSSSSARKATTKVNVASKTKAKTLTKRAKLNATKVTADKVTADKGKKAVVKTNTKREKSDGGLAKAKPFQKPLQKKTISKVSSPKLVVGEKSIVESAMPPTDTPGVAATETQTNIEPVATILEK